MDSPESSRAAETSGRPSRGGSHVGSVARFELLRQFRRRRLLVLLIIVAVLLVLFIVVLQIFGSASSDAYGYASRFGGFVTILAALAATFFGADALLGEFEQRTGYLLFPQPVSRTSIFLGKLLAAFALTTLTLAAYYGVVAAATGVVKGSVPVAFFLSSALRGTTMASVVTFALLFFVLAIASTIMSVASVRPDGNLAFAGGAVLKIPPRPYPA